MEGSGYRPSRDTVAALYGAVRGWPNCRPCTRDISGPYSIVEHPRSRLVPFSTVWHRAASVSGPLGTDTIHYRHARLAGGRLTVR